MTIELFCCPCQADHTFDLGEVERLVYRLKGGEPQDSAICLCDILAGSYEKKWVAAQIARRKELGHPKPRYRTEEECYVY